MIVTVEGMGDLEVDPGTPLAAVLDAARSPASVWCGTTALDAHHRAGVPPLVHAALLSAAPRPGRIPPTVARLRAVAGPDAGGVVGASTDLTTVGRSAGWRIADPRLSGLHLALGRRGRVRDLGSRNGTTIVRGPRRSPVGRRPRRLRPGDLIEAGGTVLRFLDPSQDARDGGAAGAAHAGPRAGHGRPWISAAGGAGGALAIAAATGRWVLALVALAAPMVALALSTRRPEAHGTPVGLERLAQVPLPVAIVGDGREAHGVARALALARSAALPPAHREPWMRWLAGGLDPGDVALVEPGGAVPTEARTVVDLARRTLTVDGAPEPWAPTAVSARTGDREARREAAGSPAALRSEIRWGDLAAASAPPATAGRRLLSAALGLAADGQFTLDLDRDGPHVLVAGTTGAGKSILLETLVSALALRLSPEDLAIGLIDLKGGTGLGPCRGLPHVRGVLTDLEPAHARHALLGLAHELRERKRALALRGLDSWATWERRGDAPARLLVVVDEFQELGAVGGGLAPELTRFAAQGRALGMHLVLATQRPAGAVTPEIRANVGTVIALRTATAAESHDLLGDGGAADLPPIPGRCIAATPRRRVELQVALPLIEPRSRVRRLDHTPAPGPRLADAARDRWRHAPPGEPLWHRPLDRPAAPPPDALGWLDVPEQRRRTPLRWDPASGPCLVVGPRGSGRTTALAAVARALPGCVALPADPREAARTLVLAEAAGVPALLVDDADRALPALEATMRGAEHALEALARRIPVALATGPGWGTRWAARAGLRIVLAGLDPVERTLWGAPPGPATPARAGRGVAIGRDGAAACVLVDATMPPTRRLVAPLVDDAEPPEGAVGVVGDGAEALVLPAHGVLVAGAPGRDRDHAVAALRAAGVTPDVADRPSPSAALVLVGGIAALRGMGLAPEPGIAEEHPAPGRVTVVRDGILEAARLRRPA